jgi:hypothetical protein
LRLRTLVLVGLAAGAVLGFAEVVQAHMEVVRAGRLLPFTGEHVREVRFFDSATLYVRRELMGPGDLINAFVLSIVSGVSLLAALLLRRRAAARTEALFFGACCLGAAYLAVDEIAGIHEAIAYNLPFLQSISLGGDPTDVIVVCLVACGVAFGLLMRRVLLASRTAIQLAGASVVLLAAAVTSDFASIPGEEAVEVLVSLSLLGAVAALALHHLVGAARPVSARDVVELEPQPVAEPAAASI